MAGRPLTSVLVANRGEIAVRILRTARRLGLRTVAVYAEADRDALHVARADEAVAIGPAPAADSYLRIDRIVEAAVRAGVDAVHPGYGFLSEHPGLAEACAAAGLVFVGPPASAIRAMGLKDRAKAIVAASGVPVVPGYEGDTVADLGAKADALGYPLLIKAVAGGGGRGIRRVDTPEDFAAAYEAARREAESAFGNGRLLIERFVPSPRHIEIQVFCDAHGNAVHLFERECSLQRRHQKVVEEAPAPGMPEAVREAMGRAAIEAARAVGYVGAGTVEFIAAGDRALAPDAFWFMEMNTRLQVEHPVTEAITGLDLVEWQLRVASGEPLPLAQDAVTMRGHAVEARLYAEDPAAGFLPSTGRLHALRLPEGEGLRVDTGFREGDAVGPYYDPLIAKLIAHGPSRAEAVARLRAALADARIAGPRTNLGFLRRLTACEAFRAGRYDTQTIARDEDALAGTGAALDPACLHRGVLALLERDRPPATGAAASPWDRADGFQLGAARRQVWPLRIDGRPDAVTLVWPEPGTGGAPEIHHRGAALRAAEPGSVEVFATDLGILVLGADGQVCLEAPDPAEAAGERSEAGGAVTAPMHGRIVAVLVAPGDRVVRGQRLGIIEAMKMEHTLTAPHDGTVAAVEARPGLQVAEGACLFTLTREASA